MRACRIAVASLAALVPAHQALAAPQAGVAAAVRGRVTLDRPSAIGMVVESGTEIELGDKIATGPNGSLQVLLLDETVFTLGPKSQMVIDEFVYDPATGDGQLDAELVKGAFRFLSGRIAKGDPDNMKVRLPSGTIGIRGTIVAVSVDPFTGRTLILLAGPGNGNSAGLPPGSIAVFNAGITRGVMRAGWGVEIPDFDSPPTEPFLVPLAMYGAFDVSAPDSGDDGGPGGSNDPGDGGTTGGGGGTGDDGGSGGGGDADGGGSSAGSGRTGSGSRTLAPSAAAGSLIDQGSAGAFFQSSFSGQTDLLGGLTEDAFAMQSGDRATTVMDLVDLSGTFDGQYLYDFFDVPTVSGGDLDLFIDIDFSANMIGVQVLEVNSPSLGTFGFGSGGTSVPFTGNIGDIADYNVQFGYFESSICMPCPTTVFLGFDNVGGQVAGTVFADVLVVDGMTQASDGAFVPPSPITQIQTGPPQ